MKLPFFIAIGTVASLSRPVHTQSLEPAANCTGDGADLVGWSDAFDGNTCQNFTDNVTLCDLQGNSGGSPGYDDITANEACLACGACDTCTDIPGYLDIFNYTCADYANDTLFDLLYDGTDDLQIGEYTDDSWCYAFGLENNAAGVSPDMACCVCGGGTRTAFMTEVPSSAPSGSPSISTAPSVSSAPSNTPSNSEAPTTSKPPSQHPSQSPTVATSPPTRSPTNTPTNAPTNVPTFTPTNSPTQPPTQPPTHALTNLPYLLDYKSSKSGKNAKSGKKIGKHGDGGRVSRNPRIQHNRGSRTKKEGQPTVYKIMSESERRDRGVSRDRVIIPTSNHMTKLFGFLRGVR